MNFIIFGDHIVNTASIRSIQMNDNKNRLILFLNYYRDKKSFDVIYENHESNDLCESRFRYLIRELCNDNNNLEDDEFDF